MSIDYECGSLRRRRRWSRMPWRAARRNGRGGGRTAAEHAGAGQKPDTTKKPAPAVSLDFQDQELKVVLDALAAAGELNVSMTNIPSQRVTRAHGPAGDARRR